ncbi:MAG: phosphoribosylglycinamide formyltransferase [Ignavibacteria bacterium]|nr:phosphoribosylglycinamide formyltransferase [Ignavibacteria bacterium]
MRIEKLENAINIAIFASGEGSNAENIIQYFEPFLDANVACVISNKENVGVLKRLRRYKVPTYCTKWYKEMDRILTKHKVHYIVLDGYLDKIPINFCKKYMYKIINIHPALLPRFGGKGMYGDNVHQAVKKSGVAETGISIHIVNEEYNTGKIIFQKIIKIIPEDTWQDIKSKVHELELKFYPLVIEKFIKGTYKYLYER